MISYYNLGDTATIILELHNEIGEIVEPLRPVIYALFSPQLKPIQGFPIPMIKLTDDISVYVAQIKIPSDPKAVGTYLCVIRWNDCKTNIICQKTEKIIIGSKGNLPMPKVLPV
jgi:hypothetical protein